MRTIAAARTVPALDDRAEDGNSSVRIGRHLLLADPLTGRYCHTSCTERTDERSGLARIFVCAKQAEREGFRPCPHCRPDRLGPRATAGADPRRFGQTLGSLFRALIFLP